ncbi:DUF2971 domain-containing protein [Vibrio coralliirubri]|uniref:DUF2971 domain-containing protein n=1 Tax=Vibrio coralliirubri TaxID=1516159 RepID=UPI002FE1D040
MIRKLYKYMPLRLNFFKEPMLRTTPIHLLNDPFEADAQHYQMMDILTHQFDEGELSTFDYQPDDGLYIEHEKRERLFHSNHRELAASELKRVTSELKQFGIVSFTEDYSNLLMWSHYADEHRGMVVELSNEVSWLKYKKSERPALCRCFEDNPFGYLREMPDRVVYRSNRPNFEFAIDVVNDLGDSKVFDSYFFSKGDSWIYEKEHRSVLPLEYADKILTSYSNDIKECEELYPNLTVSNIKYDYLKQTARCELTFLKTEQQEFSRIITCSSVTHNDNNPIFLYAVHERMISGIYLGCRVTDAEALSVLEAIKKNPNFCDSLVVKRGKMLNERYSLEFETISYPMLFSSGK